ncbi:MAG: AEC family transporter [Lautropia sp.]|nr:AEC family transporter [Lautropia sp.]
MMDAILSAFIVIILGFLVGRRFPGKKGWSAALINHYVMYVSLPALLFLPVAQSRVEDLLNVPFVMGTLCGIAACYMLGSILARWLGEGREGASLVGMACSYGTTGYMGVPLLLGVFGEKAALPAAMATVLHNIPGLMAVVVSQERWRQKGSGSWGELFRASFAVLKNPLMVSVVVGVFFSVSDVKVPQTLASLSGFLGAAAGPTALFSLGFGLAGMSLSARETLGSLGPAVWVTSIKLLVQPCVTMLVIIVLGVSLTDIWAVVALVMAAQPVGAGAYVFATQYGRFASQTSLAIIVSMLLSLLTIPLILHLSSASS